MASFVKGSRERARAHIALDGPSGAGKSYTALRWAFQLGQRVGVIDSERRSDLLYVGVTEDEKKWEFDHLELKSFSPAEYTAAIAASAAAGHDVLVIDSLSHAWEGLDGALELVARKGGNSYTAWKDVTPLHRRMVDAILTFPGHVICTMRSKTEYVLETNAAGKQVPRKVGMAPIQRPGIEYEFTLYCSLDVDHFVTVNKTRCPAMDGVTGHKPGAAWLSPFIRWLNTGEVVAPVGPRIEMATDEQIAKILQLCVDLEKTPAMHRAELFKRYSVQDANLLTRTQAAETIRIYEIRKTDREKNSLGSLPAASSASAVPAHSSDAGGENKTLQEALAEMPGSPVGGPPRDESLGTVTEAQITRLVTEREKLYASRELLDPTADKEARADLWGKLLSLFGRKSARELTQGQAQKLIEIVVAKITDARNKAAATSAASEVKETTPPAHQPAAP